MLPVTRNIRLLTFQLYHFKFCPPECAKYVATRAFHFRSFSLTLNDHKRITLAWLGYAKTAEDIAYINSVCARINRAFQLKKALGVFVKTP
jgi:hypothetical protein